VYPQAPHDLPAEHETTMEQTYFRKGFGLKKELRPLIDAEYQSGLVERIRSRGIRTSSAR
jgi:hypothetical protein